MTQRKHPVFSGFLAVVWLAVAVVSVNAANPSFNALVWTNSGGVITPIKSPTNVVSIVSGLVDNATNVALVVDTSTSWSDPAASLQEWRNDGQLKASLSSSGAFGIGGLTILDPFKADGETPYIFETSIEHTSGHLSEWLNGTNVLASLLWNGGFVGGRYTETIYPSDAGTIFSHIFDASNGESSTWDFVIGSSQDGTFNNASYIEINGDALNAGFVITVEQPDGDFWGWDMLVQNENVELEAFTGTTISTKLNPTALAGATPYILGTTVSHTSGNLAEIANNGTNVFTFNYQGGAVFGDPNNTYFFLDRTPSYTKLYSVGSVAGDQILLTSSSVSNGIETYVAGISQMSLYPDAAANQTPYKFGTSVSHSSSNLVEITNNGTNKFTVAANSGYTGAGTLFLSDDGTYKSAGGGGTAGTVINTGTPVVGNVPYYTDTTGTNVAPSTGTLTFGNASAANFTNIYNLSGANDPSLVFGNSLMELRSGTSAETFNLYNTFTDASNYERLAIRYSANIAELVTQQAGTGAARVLKIYTSGANNFEFGANGGTEWRVTTGGHLVAVSDNSYDRGSPGANRERNGYIAGALWIGGTTNTTSVRVGGTLKVDTTTTGNVGAGEDNLISYTIPANVLTVNGDTLEWRVAGTFAANANTKRARIYYGSTVIIDTTALIFNGLDWSAHGRVIRTSATAQKSSAEFTLGGTLLAALTTTISDYTTPAETLSGTVVFKVTGEDSGGVPVNDSVVQELMQLKVAPNGN